MENEEVKVVSFKRDMIPHRRVSIRICKSCGQVYILPDNDAVYYIQKYGAMPLRCESCRTKSKEYYATIETNKEKENV